MESILSLVPRSKGSGIAQIVIKKSKYMYKSLSDYSVNCLNPRNVMNPYTHEWVVASCGKCSACLKSKSNRYIGMCEEMRSHSKMALFITLTYNENWLPIAQFSDLDNEILDYVVRSYDYRTRNKTFTSYSEDKLDYNLSDRHFFNLGMPCFSSRSFLGKGQFGVLVKSDLQKFLLL